MQFLCDQKGVLRDFLNPRLFLELGSIFIFDRYKKGIVFRQCLRCSGGADGTFYLTLRAARPSACQAAKLSNKKPNQLNYRSNFCNPDFIWNSEVFSFSTDTKKASSFDNAFVVLAEWTGLEPATPGVTGRYSNQLNYHSNFLKPRLYLNLESGGGIGI